MVIASPIFKFSIRYF